MSQKAHGHKNVDPGNCECDARMFCRDIKRLANVEKKFFRCPVVEAQ